MSQVKAAEGPLTCVVDERGQAKISLVDVLYELPGVKVVTIYTADRAPLAQRIWSSEFGERVLIAANQEELDATPFLLDLTGVNFPGLSTDWKLHIVAGKFEIKVFFILVPQDGLEGRTLWEAPER